MHCGLPKLNNSHRLKKLRARLRAQEEARQSAQARMSQLAEQESALANDLESLRVAEEAQLRRLEEMKSSQPELAPLVAEIESLRTAEAEQLAQIEEAEARLRAQEEARQSAQARMSQLESKRARSPTISNFARRRRSATATAGRNEIQSAGSCAAWC